MRRAAVVACLALLVSCRSAQGPLSPDALRRLVAGREWALVSGPGQPAPLGASGLPATIRFDATVARASGYAGCNRYSAPVALRGDSLRIGPVALTRMACANDPGLEPWFVYSLERVHRAERVGDVLILVGERDARLRFAPAAPR